MICFRVIRLCYKFSKFNFFLIYRFVGGIPFSISNILPTIFNIKVKNFFFEDLKEDDFIKYWKKNGFLIIKDFFSNNDCEIFSGDGINTDESSCVDFCSQHWHCSGDLMPEGDYYCNDDNECIWDPGSDQCCDLDDGIDGGCPDDCGSGGVSTCLLYTSPSPRDRG